MLLTKYLLRVTGRKPEFEPQPHFSLKVSAAGQRRPGRDKVAGEGALVLTIWEGHGVGQLGPGLACSVPLCTSNPSVTASLPHGQPWTRTEAAVDRQFQSPCLPSSNASSVKSPRSRHHPHWAGGCLQAHLSHLGARAVQPSAGPSDGESRVSSRWSWAHNPAFSSPFFMSFLPNCLGHQPLFSSPRLPAPSHPALCCGPCPHHRPF